MSVKLLGMELSNPVMPAAGPPVKDARAAEKAVCGGAGALVTKTISVEAADVPRPNMASIRGGFLNAELWSEIGPERWLESEYPEISELNLPVIAGIGYSAEEISELASRVEEYVEAVELSTHYLGGDTTPVEESIRAAKEACELPVIVKLSPQVDIPKFASAAEKAGADGLALINSLGPTLDFDVENGRPVLGSENGYGWLSGEAVFPLALRAVYEAAASVEIPVLGVGGISRGIDAVKMLMVGASAVQVCTAAILEGPDVYGRINSEIESYMEAHDYESISDMRGEALEILPQDDNMITIPPVVNEENCTACRRCVESCVYEAIKLDVTDSYAVIDEDKCAGCGLCLTRCNFDALSIEK